MLFSTKSKRNYLRIRNLLPILFLVFSMDAAAQWKQTDGPFGNDVSAVAELQDGSIIIGVSNTGMFRSADQGQTWELINNGLEVYYNYDQSGKQPFTALGIGVSPNGTVFMGNYNGLWRSTNNGDTWTEQNISLSYSYVFDFIFPSEDLIFANTQDGIFTSTDNGDTWVKLESSSGSASGKLFLMDDGTIFANSGNDGFMARRLARSTDNGDTWEFNLPQHLKYDLFGMVKTSDGTIYGATNGDGIIYSTNNGDTWELLNDGIEHKFLRSLDITSDDYVFAGDTYGKIYRLKHGEQAWESFGPDTPQWITYGAILSSSDSHIYVAGYEGFLYKSGDLGETWESVSPRFPNVEVNGLFTAPNGSVFAFSQTDGIYRTDNRGKLWVKSHSGIDGRPKAFAMSPDGVLFTSGSSGPFKSEDNGESWISKNSGIHNLDFSLMGAASKDLVFAFRNGASGVGVFRTTDGGDSWQGVTSISKGSANDVLFTPAGDIFVSTNQGIFYSDDNGDTWTERTNGMSIVFSRALAIASDGTLYAGMAQQGGVYTSTDNGENWTLIKNGLTVTTVFDLTVDEDDIVYAATYGGGVFKLDLATTTWSSLNVDLNRPYMISIAASSDGYLYGGGLRNTVFSLRLNTPVWTKVTTGLGNSQPRDLLVMPDGKLYLATHQGLYVSTDNGDNWTAAANNGFDQKDILHLAQAADGSLIAGMFTYNKTLVHRSTDAGDNWTANADGIEGTVNTFYTFPGNKLVAGTESGIYSLNSNYEGWTKMESPNIKIASITIPSGGNVFALGWGNLYTSSDRGSSWSQLSIQDGNYAWQLAAGINNTVYMATWGGIHYSTDKGATWTKAANNNLPDNYLSIVMAADDGSIYTGVKNNGVYVSNDNGDNWEKFGLGINNDALSRTLITSPDGYLFYVTGYDVWRYPFDAEIVTSVREEKKDMISEFGLEQNYPNPFNPTTTFRFTLPNTADVSLKVYDVLGREVAVLVSGKISAGVHTYQWNASNLASGVYFYRLQAGKLVETRRLTLIK